MFSKRIVTLFAIILASLTLYQSVLAINFGNDNMKELGKNSGYAAATSDTTLSEIIGTVIKIALELVGVIFLGLMVYAGFIWMTARGDQEEANKAKGIIKTSIIGLIIVLAAYSITSFVVPKLVMITAG
jgi:hypothetical protein